MSPAHAAVLWFAICTHAGPQPRCEEGFLMHRTCAAAEAHIRAGLRPRQTLHLSECVVRS